MNQRYQQLRQEELDRQASLRERQASLEEMERQMVRQQRFMTPMYLYPPATGVTTTTNSVFVAGRGWWPQDPLHRRLDPRLAVPEGL